jgi:hypothetical protein
MIVWLRRLGSTGHNAIWLVRSEGCKKEHQRVRESTKVQPAGCRSCVARARGYQNVRCASWPGQRAHLQQIASKGGKASAAARGTR